MKELIKLGDNVRSSIDTIMSAISDLENITDDIKELQHEESDKKFAWLIDKGYAVGRRFIYCGKNENIKMKVVGYAMHDGDVSVKFMWIGGVNNGNTSFVDFGRIHGWGEKMTPLNCLHGKVRKEPTRRIRAFA